MSTPPPPGAPTPDKQLEILTAEIKSIESVQSRNFQQIQWMFTSYLAVVASYLSIGGFLGKDVVENLEKVSGFATSRWIPIIVGLPPTVLVFFLSWLVLSLFAHKVRDQLILNKHLQKVRGQRVALMGIKAMSHGCFADNNQDDPYVPEFLTYLPVIYFIGNLLLLLASVIYLAVLSRVNFSAAFAWGIAAVTLVSFFYHKAIIAYFKHYDAGRHCRTLEEIKIFESRYENNRLRLFPKMAPWLYPTAKILIVLLATFSAVVLTGMDLTPTPGLVTLSVKHSMIQLSGFYKGMVSHTHYQGLKWPVVSFCTGIALLTFLLKWRSTKLGNEHARRSAVEELEQFRRKSAESNDAGL